MFRSRVLQGCVALFTLAVPVGIASAGTTEPDDTSAVPTEPVDSTEPAAPASDVSGPPSASAPEGTAVDDSGGGQPPEDIEFQIDMMLGLVPEDEQQDYWAQQSQASEQAIVDCMNAAGFEYEPMGAEEMSFDPYNGLSRLEYAQQYGFGMWTTMDPENQQTGSMTEWPNQSIVDELTPEEQNAWFEVSNRCSQEAYAGTNDPWSNPMVMQIMEDFRQDVENDPRYRDAVSAWQECMADSGHPFASQDEMYEQVYASMEDEEMSALQSQFYESQAWLDTSPDHDQWQALVDEEIEIAVADATCTPALDEAREEIQRDLRDDLVAVWQTIDWSLPPVTYEEMMFPGETVVEEPSGTDVGTTEAAPAGTGGDPSETTETPVGLDLGGAPETTEP